MTQRDEFDFTQFKGQFDSAMSPDTDFAERMQKMLSEKSTESSQPRNTTVIASPSRAGKDVPAPGRRSHPLTIAASIAVVLAVVFSSIWVLRGTQLEGEYGSAPSGVATLPADAETTPGADVQLESQLAIPYEFESTSNPYLIDVIDGVAYTSLTGPSSTSDQDVHTEYLIAMDLESGKQLWEVEGYSLWNLEQSDGVLVGFRSTFPPIEERRDNTEWWPTTSMVGLDAASGEPLWEHAFADTIESRVWTYQYAITDNQVVTLDTDGKMTALDLQTGAENWFTDVDLGSGHETELFSNESEEPVQLTIHDAAIASWNGDVAMVNGDGLVQLIDGNTGEITATHTIGGSPTGPLQLQVLPQGLLLTRFEDGYHLTAFNPESGDIFWDREIEGDVRAEVAENGMIAVNSHVWEQGNFIMRLLGRGGHATFQFLWIDGATGEEVMTTERGRVDNPVFAITDGEYLCARVDEFVCYNRAGTRHVIADGPWSEAYFDNGALYFDGEDGVYRVNLP